jgi:hypothetical protein
MKFRGESPQKSASLAGGAGRASSGGAISSRRGKRDLTAGMRIGLGLFFGVFFIAGSLGTYAFAVKPWQEVWAARTWVPVDCRILSSEVKSHDGDSTTYSVAITYAYEIDGRAYTGSRYDFTAGSSSGRKAKKDIVARHPAGRMTVCHVDPEQPHEAVIERSRVRDWGYGLIPLVFVLVGAGGVWFALFGQRKKSASGLHAEAPVTPYAHAAFRRAEARLSDPDEALSDAGGPVELKPAESRAGRLIGVAFFALFWNGIVSVFLFNVVGDALRGSGISWVFVLFLIPFVGIGLFLLGLVARHAMALANPVPRLTVNRRVLCPGDTLELDWRFDGAAGRLTQVRLFLEGREEATYRRGTDTKTDRAVFATHEIAQAAGLGAGAPSRAKLRLPERLMHSFKADNNRIVWSLRVQGTVARWPDVEEAFELSIRPPQRHVPTPPAPPSSKS